MTIAFELDGHTFTALNGGPQFKFTAAISLQVNCDTQKQIDSYWENLSKGGKKGPCGWLKAKYGLSWQIVPRGMEDLMNKSDPAARERVMAAVMKSKKLKIVELEKAAKG